MVLRPHVKHVKWLRYNEKPTDKALPDALVAHQALMRQLTGLCKNLSFKKEQVEEAFNKIMLENDFEALSSPELQTDWVETMAKRVRLMCRHLAQARIRKPCPKWVLLIDSCAPAAVDGQMEASPSAMSQPPEAQQPAPGVAQAAVVGESRQQDGVPDHGAAAEDKGEQPAGGEPAPQALELQLGGLEVLLAIRNLHSHP